MNYFVALFAVLAFTASVLPDAAAASSDAAGQGVKARSSTARSAAPARTPQAKPKPKAKSTAKAAGKGSASKAGASKGSASKARAAPIDYQGDQVNFSSWPAMRSFVDEMVARHGFERAALEAQLDQLRLIDAAQQLVKPAPPGKPKNWQAYSERFIEPIRIQAGVRFWNEHAATLARAEAAYGVPAEILVGIIGVETVYGRDTGRFRVLDTLATLAFAYPEAPNREARSAFFRSELEQTLLLARHEQIDPLSLLGSFAGAVGLPQFMPGNVLKFGVDFDGDGHVDLRNSPADAIGSVANFLIQHGWQAGQTGPAVFAVTPAPHRAWEPLLERGLAASLSVAELEAAGVAVPPALANARLLGLVDMQNGAEPSSYWLATDNFFAITKYNRSYFYAMSVLELGAAVRNARAGPAPTVGTL